MMKILRRIGKIFLWIFMVLIVLVLVINTPMVLFTGFSSDKDYSNWMSENLSNNQKVIDISMLGAHDTFSDQIALFSKVDKLSASSVMTGVTGFLIKGFSVKQSKTQISNVSALLEKGIRYLDVRITYDSEDDKWYTVHNFYSDRLLPSLERVADFLKKNPGEFVIIDLQHVYGLDYSSQADFNKLYDVLTQSGIIDYAYPNNIKSLSDVTYGDVTDNGTKSGAIILSKFEHNNQYIWDYVSSIRSAWADSDNFNQILTFLRSEKDLIDSGQALTGNQMGSASAQVDSQNAFRVMQGVATMQMTPEGILKGITSWSLMERAKRFNTFLITQSDFEDLEKAMPIIMVDYADSNYHNFLETAMTQVISYDKAG